MTDFSRANEVKDFYNQVGWQRISDELYQNAIYEDLRPVSREYIERCHLRVNRHLNRQGKYLLDAGCGPVQWPAYLTYSEGYRYRVCMDISLVALEEARNRLGEKGLYVVGDISHLPFKENSFGSTVSMHTLHHLSSEDQKNAYSEMFRTLDVQGKMVVVNGSSSSRLMESWLWLVKVAERLGVKTSVEAKTVKTSETQPATKNGLDKEARGTFTRKNSIAWIETELKVYDPKLLPWRSVSVRFMRALIHPWLAGKYWLRFLFWREERDPRWYAENGQYPMLVIEKE
jgi:ubiquinone/menaquinone biosynthesis C-methylase UbiE